VHIINFVILILLLLFLVPTSTKPVGGNIEVKQRLKASTGISLRNHGFLEGDNIASLYSHGLDKHLLLLLL